MQGYSGSLCGRVQINGASVCHKMTHHCEHSIGWHRWGGFFEFKFCLRYSLFGLVGSISGLLYFDHIPDAGKCFRS